MSKGKWPSLRWSQPVMSYNTSGGSPFISQEAQPTMATKRKHRKEGRGNGPHGFRSYKNIRIQARRKWKVSHRDSTESVRRTLS